MIVPSGVEPLSPGPKPGRITTTPRDYKHLSKMNNRIVPSGVEPLSMGPEPIRIATTPRDYKRLKPLPTANYPHDRGFQGLAGAPSSTFMCWFAGSAAPPSPAII